jgi:hypothetical protein
VDLQAELPSLKALCRTARERAIAAGIVLDEDNGCEELQEALAGV